MSETTDKALRERDVLAQVSAHDFNNLLCSILGQAELLTTGSRDDAVIQRRVAAIRRAASRGIELTRKLAAFGASEPMEKRSLDPVKVLHEDLERFRGLLTESVVLVVRIEPDVRVYADHVALQQVVVELLHNARVYGASGGRICLEIHRSEHGEGSVVRVRDQGVGFPEDADLAELLIPFVGRGGRAIGLAAIHHVMQGHCGTVQLKNETGAVVECFFPPSQ